MLMTLRVCARPWRGSAKGKKKVYACICVHRENQRDLRSALKKESWRGLKRRALCLHLRWQSDSQIPQSRYWPSFS